MELISIIVPVYNVEQYLEKCVGSILNQTYKNLEVILVDDGSTDKSGHICDELSYKDNRIKVIHKKNGGLSDARNVGLDICTGEYVGFVDSDDYISEEMYQKLYCFACENNLDVAMCAAADVFETHINYGEKFQSYILDDKTDMIKDIYMNRHGGASIAVWNKLYKRQILENERFEVGITSEDVLFALRWINKTQRFGRIDFVGYFYVCRIGSICHLVSYKDSLLDVVATYEINERIIETEYKGAVIASKYRLLWANQTAIARILDCSDADEHYKEIKILQKELRNNLKWLLRKEIFVFLPLKQIIGYTLLAIDSRIYMFARNIKRSVR